MSLLAFVVSFFLLRAWVSPQNLILSSPALNHSSSPSSNTSSNSSSFTPPNTSALVNVSTSSLNSSSPSNSSLASLEESDQDYLSHALNLHINPPIGVLGALLVLTGTPMAFWGSRNRWSSYFLIGAYISAAVVAVPILRFGVVEQAHRPTIVIQGLFLIAIVISAVLFGAVGVIFWKGTRFLVGASGGFILSIYILSLKSNVLIAPLGFRWIFIVLSTSVGFILNTIPSSVILTNLFSTAIVGSAILVLGIDCFTTGGLKEFWLFIVGFSDLFDSRLKSRFPLTVTMQVELGVMAGVFLMGSAVQWRLLEVIRKKIHELKQMDRERELVEEAAAYKQSMALEADLARWEDKHGAGDHHDNKADHDRGDSPTLMGPDQLFGKRSPTPQNRASSRMTDNSLSKIGHARRASEISLLNSHDIRTEPFSTQDLYHPVSKSSTDHLPIPDTGFELAGSLGVEVINQSPTRPRTQNGSGDNPRPLSTVRKGAGPAGPLPSHHRHNKSLSNQIPSTVSPTSSAFKTSPERRRSPLPSSADQGSPMSTSQQNQTSSSSSPALSANPGSLRIDYGKFEGDRRVSRPPGAPKTWNTPMSSLVPGNLGTSTNPLDDPLSGRRPTSSFAPLNPSSSRPLSFPSHTLAEPNLGEAFASNHHPAPLNRYSRRLSPADRRISDAGPLDGPTGQVIHHYDNPLDHHAQHRASPRGPRVKRESMGGHTQAAQHSRDIGTRGPATGQLPSSRRQSKGFIDLNEPSDRMGRPLPLDALKSPASPSRPRPNHVRSQSSQMPSNLNPSSPVSSHHRVISSSNIQSGADLGSHYIQQSRQNNRSSQQVMTIEELNERHRNAMKKIQNKS